MGMNGKKIGDKALVVKVDAKTKKILDEYIVERSKKNGDAKQPEGEEIENYMDEDLKYDDKLAMDRMGQILSDHSKEMENFVPKETPGLPMPKEGPPTATLLQRMGTRDEGLDNVEEEKKGIVTREIDKFRETMKIREAEKEEQDKKRKGSKSPSRRKSKSRERDSESRSRDSRRRDRSRSKDRETRSSARRSRSRDKRRSVVSKSRSRSPPRFVREPVRSRERDTRTQKEILKEREMEEEEKEIKRAARKAEEKELIYQERLRLWEARESKKGKEYTKESQKEKMKGMIRNSTRGGSYREGWLTGSEKLRRMQKIAKENWTKYLIQSLPILLQSSKSGCKSASSSSSQTLFECLSPLQGRWQLSRKPRRWQSLPSHSMRHHRHHRSGLHPQWRTTTKAETTVWNKKRVHNQSHSQLLRRSS